MKKVLGLALGILTAIGGYVDIGDIVTSSVSGARFGVSLLWVIVLGTGGICLYAEMAGRVVAVTRRPVFDLVRERLGARAGLVNLLASFVINALTLAAEIGGVAIAIELATSVNYLLWVPLVGFLAWLVVWKLPFSVMDNVFGLVGLVLIVFVVALVRLHPDWHGLFSAAVRPTVPSGEGHPTWFYYAIAIFGATMTPYEVFFFSSGGIEEGWEGDLIEPRMNVFIGFPLGALISAAIMLCSATVFSPLGIEVDHLSQVGLPVALAVGKLGVAVMILGFVAATFGALLETLLSSGYTVAQYFGWSWGKLLPPARAARFQTLLLFTLLGGLALTLTTVDPVKVTEYSVVLSAAALPLTYLPILVVANDRRYLGEKVNRWYTNTLATAYLVLILVASLATLPLMLATKAGL